MASVELRRAATYIRQGQRAEARRLLASYLKSNPRDASGWLLLSHVLDDKNQQIECVRRAIRLDPQNQHAKTRLELLSTPHSMGAAPPQDQVPVSPPHSRSGISEPTRQAAGESFLEGIEPGTPEWAKSVPAHASATEPEETSPPPDDTQIDDGTKWSEPKRGNLRAYLVAGAAVLCFAAVLVSLIGYPRAQAIYARLQSTRSAERIELVAAQLGTAQPTLPPSWTPTPEPSITLTPTITPSITPTPPPTLVGLSEQEQEEMYVIQTEVADLRGLNVAADVQGYILDKGRVRPILEDLFYAGGGTEAEVEDQKRALIALGMVKPTYNMFDNILNNIADGIGGFYDPETKEIYVLGFVFGGVEHYIYSHEFDHALVDQHFDLNSYGNYPVCLTNGDKCKAIDALIEGDASLLMDLWWDQYASVQDYQDILRYNPPWYTLPEQFPPPYASLDASFPYASGQIFVEYLYARGNWAEVNRAYQDPPESTEHILHPQKYIAGERPVELQAYELLPALGDGWRELTIDTLGEWGTYLLLGYGADLEAQVDDFTAEQAAAGWGGDTYQVYFNDGLQRTVMSARWSWDSNSDATQFHTAMLEYLDARFRGAKLDRSSGECWEANNQASCVFRSGREVLWLLAPDQSDLDNALASIPGYQ